MKLSKGWVVLTRLLQMVMFRFEYAPAGDVGRGRGEIGWKCGSRGEEVRVDRLALYL
jgi:hypothetical protein